VRGPAGLLARNLVVWGVWRSRRESSNGLCRCTCQEYRGWSESEKGKGRNHKGGGLIAIKEFPQDGRETDDSWETKKTKKTTDRKILQDSSSFSTGEKKKDSSKEKRKGGKKNRNCTSSQHGYFEGILVKKNSFYISGEKSGTKTLEKKRKQDGKSPKRRTVLS